MSQTSDMWDRFFAGSKYEHKWLRTRFLAAARADLREEAVLLIERLEALPFPRAETGNPFDGSKHSRAA